MKRIFYLLGIIVTVGGVVILGYLFRYRGGIIPPIPPATPGGNQPTPAPLGASSPSSTSQSTIIPKAFSVLVNTPVFDYFAKNAGEAVFIEPNGHVSSLLGGRSSVVSSETIDGLMRAQFSHNGSYLLVKSRVGNNAQFKILNLAQRTWTPVPTGTREAAWSPSDDRLLLLLEKGATNELAIFNAANPSTKLQSLTPLDTIDVSLMWPHPLTIIIESRGSSLSEGFVLVFSIKDKVFTGSVENQLGLISLWNGGGTRGLLWTSNNTKRGGELSLVNQLGTLVHNLTFKTLPSKCAFGSTARASGNATGTTESLFCAIPRDQEEFLFHPLPDDYEKGLLKTADDLYQVDLGGGNLASITTDDGIKTFDATKMTINNGVLFFINRLDGKLYALSMGN